MTVNRLIQVLNSLPYDQGDKEVFFRTKVEDVGPYRETETVDNRVTAVTIAEKRIILT